jgi:hypothetical protein
MTTITINGTVTFDEIVQPAEHRHQCARRDADGGGKEKAPRERRGFPTLPSAVT